MAAKRTAALNTAVCVLKGALVNVLGVPNGRSTIGVHFSEGNKARLTCQCTRRL